MLKLLKLLELLQLGLLELLKLLELLLLERLELRVVFPTLHDGLHALPANQGCAQKAMPAPVSAKAVPVGET